MTKALIFRESVYTNHFRCNRCHVQLMDEETMTPTEFLAKPKLLPSDRLYCKNCGNCVAFIRPYFGKKKGGARWEGMFK